MKKKLLVLLFSLATLGLASCGGGNDVASSGATAVSAAAPTTTTVGTEAKVNGQVDERTGVAPVVAAMTLAQTVTACTASSTYGGTGALLTSTTAPTSTQCATALPNIATGNPWTVYSNSGCGQSSNWVWNQGSSMPALNLAQQAACRAAYLTTGRGGNGGSTECNNLGGGPVQFGTGNETYGYCW